MILFVDLFGWCHISFVRGATLKTQDEAAASLSLKEKFSIFTQHLLRRMTQANGFRNYVSTQQGT